MKKILLTLFLLLFSVNSFAAAINTRPTDYTEYDTEFSGTITDNSIAVTSFSSRDVKYYVYETESNENFTVDFTTSFQVLDDAAIVLPIAFTNVIGDGSDYGSNPYFGCYFINSGGTRTFYASGYTSGSAAQSTGYTYTLNEVLYCTMVKSGSSLSIKIYDDPARDVGDLLSTETVAASVSDTYAYIVMMAGSDSATGGVAKGSISDIYDSGNDSTHSLTISTGRGAWSAISSSDVHYGPVTSDSLNLKPGQYEIYFKSEEGYLEKENFDVYLGNTTSLTSSYTSKAAIASVVNLAEGAFPLGRLVDFSSNDNSMTILGTATNITSVADEQGTANSAYLFAGVSSNDRIRITNAAFDYTGSHSVGCKYKATTIGVSGVFLTDWATLDTDKKNIFGVDTTNEYYFFIQNTALTTFIVRSTTLQQVGVEHSVVGVYDAGNNEIRIYVDGALENTTATTGTIQSGIGAVTIGGYHDGGGAAILDGRIDDVFTMSGALVLNGASDYNSTDTDFKSSTTGTLDVTITGSNLTRFNVDDGISEAGPFKSGAHEAKAGTHTLTFDSAPGYPSPPSDTTGVVVTDGGTTNESKTYTPYATSEVYVASGASGTGASCSDPADFSGVNQTTLAAGATIYVCGQYTDMIELERADLKVSSATDGYIDGAKEIETTWETTATANVYRTQLNLSNADYIQETEPVAPSIGERWYMTRWDQATWRVVSKVVRIWDGSEWQYDPDGYLMPSKIWLDGEQVNVSVFPSSGLSTAQTLSDTALTDSALSGVVVDDTSFVTLKKVPWLFERLMVNSQVSTTLNYNESNNALTILQNQYYVSNILSQVNSHGDWSYDYENGWFYIYLDTAPANYTVEYSALNHGVFSYGNSDITIDGLTAKRTNTSPIKIMETGSGDITVTNNVISDYSSYGEPAYNDGGIDVQAVDPWDYNYVTAFNQGNYSNVERSYNLTITGNIISDGQGAHGINAYLFAEGTITGNKVFDVGYSAKKRILENGTPSGINTKGCWNVDIDNTNVIASVSYRGVMVVSGGALIDGNIIGNTMRNATDGAAIGAFSISTSNNIVSNNILNDTIGSTYDTYSSFIGGVYLDQDAHLNTVTSNEGYYLEGATLTALINNNTEDVKPYNYYDSNDFYEDSTFDDFEYDINGTFGTNNQLAESAWTTYTLNINCPGNFYLSVNGTYSAYAPSTNHTLPKGSYVITYEDTGENTPIDEVIALTENTVLNRRVSKSWMGGLLKSIAGLDNPKSWAGLGASAPTSPFEDFSTYTLAGAQSTDIVISGTSNEIATFTGDPFLDTAYLTKAESTSEIFEHKFVVNASTWSTTTTSNLIVWAVTNDTSGLSAGFRDIADLNVADIPYISLDFRSVGGTRRFYLSEQDGTSVSVLDGTGSGTPMALSTDYYITVTGTDTGSFGDVAVTIRTVSHTGTIYASIAAASLTVAHTNTEFYAQSTYDQNSTTDNAVVVVKEVEL